MFKLEYYKLYKTNQKVLKNTLNKYKSLETESSILPWLFIMLVKAFKKVLCFLLNFLDSINIYFNTNVFLPSLYKVIKLYFYNKET